MTALGRALAVAEAAADEAAIIATAGLGRAREVTRKQSVSDLVTEFDLAVERAVVARLHAAFPDHAIIGEEGTDDRSSQRGGIARWYVDPIDGTTNFAHGLPFFCTSIALVDEHGPAVGVIEAPGLGWRFTATRGAGAFLREHGSVRRLVVSDTVRLDAALLATGFPYDLRTSPDDNVREFVALQKAGQAVRRVGSAALDLAMLAAGWFDGYWEQKLKPWDVAAGILIVTESGGRVTDFAGGPVELERGALVASNGHVHAALLDAVAVAAARPRHARGTLDRKPA